MSETQNGAATPEERMTVAAARQVEDRQVLLVGVGPPNAAANLARRLQAPDAAPPPPARPAGGARGPGPRSSSGGRAGAGPPPPPCRCRSATTTSPRPPP